MIITIAFFNQRGYKKNETKSTNLWIVKELIIIIVSKSLNLIQLWDKCLLWTQKC